MSKLPDSICSPQDLTALILEVSEYAKWYEHETVKRQAGATQQSTPPVLSLTGATFLRSLSQNGTLAATQLDRALAELRA